MAAFRKPGLRTRLRWQTALRNKACATASFLTSRLDSIGSGTASGGVGGTAAAGNPTGAMGAGAGTGAGAAAAQAAVDAKYATAEKAVAAAKAVVEARGKAEANPDDSQLAVKAAAAEVQALFAALKAKRSAERIRALRSFSLAAAQCSYQFLFEKSRSYWWGPSSP